MSNKLDQAMTWTGGATALRALLSLGRAVLLARLMAPAALGVWSAVQAVIGLAALLRLLGTNDLVYVHDLSEEQHTSLVWSDLFWGCLAYALAWELSPVFAAWYQIPEMIWPLRIAALELPLGACSQLGYALLKKSLRVSLLELMRVGVFGSGILVFWGLARRGAGVWAFVGESLFQWAISMLIVLWRTRSLRLSAFSGAALRPFLMFGLRLSGAQGLSSLLSHVSSLVLFRHFGAEAMGIAAFAWRFAKQMPDRLAPVVMRYVLPLFVGREIRTRQVASRLLAMLIPVFVGLLGLSPWLVPLVFGEQWRPAIPFIQVMSVSAFASALLQPVAPWLLSRAYVWGVVCWNVLVSVGGVFGAWLAVRRDVLLLSSIVSAGWVSVLLAGVVYIKFRMASRSSGATIIKSSISSCS